MIAFIKKNVLLIWIVSLLLVLIVVCAYHKLAYYKLVKDVENINVIYKKEQAYQKLLELEADDLIEIVKIDKSDLIISDYIDNKNYFNDELSYHKIVKVFNDEEIFLNITFNSRRELLYKKLTFTFLIFVFIYILMKKNFQVQDIYFKIFKGLSPISISRNHIASNEVVLKKEEFIASIVHNLKDTIISNRTLLEEYTIESNNIYLNEIDYNNEIILSDINKITDIAFDNNSLDITNKSKIKLDEMINNILVFYKRVLDSKDIKIVLSFEKDNSIYINSIAIKVIFYNIISNLSKYTKDNGLVEIKIRKKHKKTIILFSNECQNIDVAKIKFDINNKNINYGKVESTGTGLYTIASLIKIINQEIKIDVKNNIFLIKITLLNIDN